MNVHILFRDGNLLKSICERRREIFQRFTSMQNFHMYAVKHVLIFYN